VRGLNIGFNVGPLTLVAFTGVVQLQAPSAALSSTVPAAYTLAASPGIFSLAGKAATLSAGNGAFVLPSAPATVSLLLQGQTSANNTPSPPAPSSPNYQQIGWTAAVAGTNPVASYNVYRSTNGAAYVQYATGITGLTFADTAATLCVNGTQGSGPVYYQANSYLYQVTAVDSAGNEGPRSSTQQFYIYKNGYHWGGDYDNGASQNYADTSLNPQAGSSVDCAVTTTVAYGETLWYAGNLVTTWNMWVGWATHLYLDIQPTKSGQDWKLYALRVGDVGIYGPTPGSQPSIQLSSYGTFTAGKWTRLSIPLADFLTDYGPSGAGPPVVQNAFYKFAIQDSTSNTSNEWGLDNVLLSAGADPPIGS
jgi:hypothetical protein